MELTTTTTETHHLAITLEELGLPEGPWRVESAYIGWTTDDPAKTPKLFVNYVPLPQVLK